MSELRHIVPEMRDNRTLILWVRKLKLKEDRHHNLKFTQLLYSSKWQLPEATL